MAMPAFKPAIGHDDFEGIVCDLDDDLAEQPAEGDEKAGKPKPEEMLPGNDSGSRRLAMKFFMCLFVGALAVTGLYGLATYDWIPLTSVWLVVAAPLGVMFDRYVGKPGANKAMPIP